MKCPNRSRLTALCLSGLLLSQVLGYAQLADSPVEIGYVSLTTAQQSKVDGQGDSFAPNLLVRFTRTDGVGRVLAVTDQSGTAIVPLEPGAYCVSAYGLDGKPVVMTARSQEAAHRCLTIKVGTTIEFSVTLASDAKYSRSIPPLGVE